MIVENLEVRDMLEARLVCKDWNQFLLNSVLMDKVMLSIGKKEDFRGFVKSSTIGKWTTFEFETINLTFSSRQLQFWNLYGDNITSITFFQSTITIPRNLNWNSANVSWLQKKTACRTGAQDTICTCTYTI